jgi:asparagine synthase (glutamine-hydrolysing)
MDVEPYSESDCEVILDLYFKYGIEYTCKVLDGVFAFVLHDCSTETTYFVRDPFGVRPMYYFNSTPNFGAASDMKSLVKFNFKINHFPPGSFAVINNNTMTINSYFSLNSLYLPLCNTLQEEYSRYTSLINMTFTEAVKKRLMSDRPVACLLSGGLDSSLVTALVCKLTGKKIQTFSIGLEGSPDLEYANKVATYLDTKHTSVIVSEKDFIEAIPETIKTIESYDTTTVRASVGNYLISKYISENSDCKVIFNGDGSDELFGGYLYFHSSPSVLDSDKETVRLLKDIHKYDVLRSDKSISSCGLEPRTPFLDKTFVSTFRSIPIHYRFQKGEIEKKIIRDSFKDYLPNEILYRQKEAFSDGVSSKSRSWYEIIGDHVKNCEVKNYNVKHLNIKTSEQSYYYKLFQKDYPHCEHIIPYYWMPKWSNTDDPSARTLNK